MLPHTPRLSTGIPSRVLPAPADQRPAVSSPAGRDRSSPIGANESGYDLLKAGLVARLRADSLPVRVVPRLNDSAHESASIWSKPDGAGTAEQTAADVEAVLRREPDFAAGFADEMTVRQRREGQPDGMMAAACAVVVVLFVVAIGCGVFIAPAVRQLLGAL